VISEGRRFIAGALVAVGGLMVLLCGSCTVMFGGGGLIGLIQGEDAALSGTLLITAALLGGLPTTAGVVLVRSGLKTLREGNAHQPEQPPSSAHPGDGRDPN
jgi:hypothetical protein